MTVRIPKPQKYGRDASELYEQHASWLRTAIAKRYGRQNADDLAQEVWARVIPYQNRVRVRSARAFLLKVAANLFWDSLRRSGGSVYGQERHVEPRMGWDLSTQNEVVFAKQLILSLPQPLRDVFVLSRFGGLTNEQIAEQLGIRPKTVEWRMTKALAHCAAQYRR
ncbi:hypothetical protein ER13_02160 [Brevundimonas sp. EAKA]|uniref:RNA polymerase sigma factor n=1 Tax=Brevundimonas sp. EAKA TaxID=1495854 RepID=UPI0004A914BA|nr:RNA polymerase sigma factor [Brevundimonas sp. EAKA]KDP95401.1 hypothetical protein ER13_02160 [Brevundimonas sp. EAKA]